MDEDFSEYGDKTRAKLSMASWDIDGFHRVTIQP